MFRFLSPIDTISSLALLVLAVFGLVQLSTALRHSLYLNRRHLIILRIDPRLVTDRIGDFLGSIRPPFTFEAAVHYLGREVNYYVVLPRKRARELMAREGINEVDDYDLFHHGGEHLGAYLKGGEVCPAIDVGKIDLSKVNEIGEGVAIQMVFGRRRGRKLMANFRILVSAPSNYQAKEILAAIKPSFPGFNLIESRSDDFISRVNFREYDAKQSTCWEPV
ncbi:MAG: hypothetical protein PHV43_00930 [Candidatus Colwellbacteria bacterium]|nr:hypothetical protein [Candidatus Colwellbacteria bacterium]